MPFDNDRYSEFNPSKDGPSQPAPQYRKPSWMTLDGWKHFQARWLEGDIYRCQASLEELTSENFSVDHIISRAQWKDRNLEGSADVCTNLQPMRRDLNSSKGPRDDAVWGRKLYFDRPIERDALRASQSDYVYDVIMNNADEFGRSYGLINSALFMFCQIVGAGKTLGMFVLAFALNAAARRSGPANTRVDRMLILTKDQSLRHQIAAELRDEPVKFGLVDKAPRVLEVKRGDQLLPNTISNYDIVVACGQQFWGKRGGCYSLEETERILCQFPLIAFDEVHWANDQARRILRLASHSLCAGFTASPIRSCGESLLDDLVRCSTYGFRDAVRNDNSMKSLGATLQIGSEETNFDDIIHVVSTEAFRMYGESEWRKYGDSTNDAELLSGSLKATLSVACEVVRKISELDSLPADDMTISEHRRDYTKHEVVPGHRFHPHAIIRVGDRRSAQMLTDFLNRMFQDNGVKYPRGKGYRAECAYSGTTNDPGKPLSENHPWFYAKRHGGRVNRKAARFLVVCNMATEGVNNKHASVIGFAHQLQSMVQVVQSVGRLIRSDHKEEDGKHIVPPAALDRVCVITHQAYGNTDLLRDGLRFLGQMHQQIEDIMSVEKYFEQCDGSLEELEMHTPSESITFFQKLNIVDRVGDDLAGGRITSVKDLQAAAGAKSRQKKKQVREVVEQLVNQNPQRVRRLRNRLHIAPDPGRIEVPEDELLNFDRTPEQLDEWASKLDFMQRVTLFKDRIPEGCYYPALNDIHGELAKSHHTSPSEANETVATVIDTLTDDLLQNVPCVTRFSPQLIRPMVEGAVQLLLNTTETFDDESEFNNIHILHQLRRTSIRHRIWGHVIYCLARNGKLKSIFQVMRLEELVSDEEDDNAL